MNPVQVGDYGSELLKTALIKHNPGELPKKDWDTLKRLFIGIGEVWETTDSVLPLSLLSHWREFISTRCEEEPSYLGEYENGAGVLHELYGDYGTRAAHEFVFLESGEPPDEPANRFEHFKKYVVAEFIEVYLAAGGFKAFGAENYGGYIAGSRYRRETPYHTELELSDG